MQLRCAWRVSYDHFSPPLVIATIASCEGRSMVRPRSGFKAAVPPATSTLVLEIRPGCGKTRPQWKIANAF